MPSSEEDNHHVQLRIITPPPPVILCSGTYGNENEHGERKFEAGAPLPDEPDTEPRSGVPDQVCGQHKQELLIMCWQPQGEGDQVPLGVTDRLGENDMRTSEEYSVHDFTKLEEETKIIASFTVRGCGWRGNGA